MNKLINVSYLYNGQGKKKKNKTPTIKLDNNSLDNNSGPLINQEMDK